MLDTRTVIDNYIAMWNEPEPGRRRRLIAETLTEAAIYLDPLSAPAVSVGEGAPLRKPRETRG